MRSWLLAFLVGSSVEAHADLYTAARNLPDVRDELVDQAVEAALAAETDQVPASLLLSIAWGESRLEPSLRSGRVCGPLQVIPETVGAKASSACGVWRDEPVRAYFAAVRELEKMLADRRVHGDMRLALLYRACGNAAFNGKCKKRGWPGWVLTRKATIERDSQ